LKNRVSSSVPASPSTARELAVAFGSLKKIGVTERYVYLEILRVALLRNPRYWGVWTIWAPNALDGADHRYLNEEGHDHTGRFVPLWRRDKVGQNIKLEPNIGYEIPGVGDYYLIPIQKRREITFSAYEYRPINHPPLTITSQVAPIFCDGECVGVAGYDISVSREEAVPLGQRLRYSGSFRDKVESSLTGREREVLSWVSQGKSNAEVGIILGISAHTVKHHMEKILAKLGVENRHAAMLFALQLESSSADHAHLNLAITA
jgi:DNA-binding CsgD family transcriptional regulator